MDWLNNLSDVFEKRDIDALSFANLFESTTSWCICGKGTMGRKVAQALVSRGKKVLAFIDSKSKEGDLVDGFPCFTKERLPESFRDIPVVVAIHNPQFDVIAARSELEAAGCSRVLLLQNVIDCLPEVSNFWLAPYTGVDFRNAALSGLTFFDEEISKAMYCDIFSFRLLGTSAPQPEFPQYFPTSLPRVEEPMRWVDCRAFTGDTLDEVKSLGLSVESCYAFEPDPENYKVLAAKYTGHAHLMPCGVSDGMSMAMFMPDGPSGHIVSRMAKDENVEAIQLCTLDDVLADSTPNFIKMDIEGAEMLALHGASRIIINSPPRLAISSYHNPSHIFEIPKLLKNLGFTGMFHLRSHANNTFDSVIYGLPAK